MESINRLKLMQKMKAIKCLAVAFLALSAVSCEEPFVEEINPNNPEEQEFVVKQITLEAKKSSEEISRIYIGSADAEKGTIYHWNEDDHVGVFALNSGAVDKNYEGTIKGVYENDKNNARFEAFVNYDPENTENTDLFVYWPYNSSNVVTGTTTDVPAYLAKTGVQIRTLNQQNQSVYNPVAGEENATEHPSVNISKYGAAYDMTTCDEEGHAKFKLHHATAYLQFNLYGGTSEGSDVNYGNGNFEVSNVIVRLGKVTGQVSQGLLANGATFTPVQIAGNFIYHIPTYNKNAVKAEDVQLLKSGGDESVMVSLDETQKLSSSTPVPVFAVVNASNVTTANVNAIEAVVTVVEKNENGSPINSYTRTRYISLGRNTIKGGDYYTIKYTVNDPVEAATRLDNLGGSNCYIIPYPGKYLFDVSYPGNGVMPAYADYATLGLAGLVDENGKFFTEETMDYFEVCYLWASGTTFQQVYNANPSLTDDGVVEKVVKVERYAENVMLTINETGADLNGNLVVALHKKDSREVVWSWHLWFARPNVQYFKFPVTRPAVGINNEHWYMFDRNVGAETAELGNTLSYGLYYQLGRHTPFITPSGNGTWPNWNQEVFVNTYFTEGQQNWAIEYMNNGNNYPYARPMTMNSSGARNTSDGLLDNIWEYSWVSSDNAAEDNSKTFFDPCPLGYKLPTTREWDNFKENQFEKTEPAAKSSGVFGYAAPRNVHQNDAAYVNAYNSTEKVGWSTERMSLDANGQETTITVYDSLVAVHGDFAAILNERMAAGNKFEHLAGGRTYLSTTLSGSGTPITTNFPNTGVIEVSGTTATAKYMADGDATLDHDANFVLWAAGRLELPVDDNGNLIAPEDYAEGYVATFSPHWFGPMDWYNDSFAPVKVDLSYTNWTCWAPWTWFNDSGNYSVQRAYGPIGTRPYNISGIDGTWGNDNAGNSFNAGGTGTAPKNSGNYAGQAAPVRCIREYNSTTATAEE